MYNFLVVDNSTTVLDVMEFTLEKFNYAVFSATTSGEIFDILHNYKIDVVLLNDEVEDVSGIDIARKIKQTYDTIVLIMSYSQNLNEKLKAKEAGVSGWVVKPFIPERLVKIIIKTFFA